MEVYIAMGNFRNIKYTYEGSSIMIPLTQFSEEDIYKGYAASCQYKFNKKEQK